MAAGVLGLLLCASLVVATAARVQAASETEPALSNERVVFQLESGDFEFAFYPEVAPVTTAHIFKLVQLGLYTTNHIFRVDKGFVAQVADVVGNRQIPYMNDQQKEHAGKKVPLEVRQDVKHHTGVVSMGRYDDPNSGTSSFSILLGDAPHLDMKYTIFGRVTRGMDVIHALESLPTRKEGIFVMPLKRITILNSYWYSVSPLPSHLTLPASDAAKALASGATGHGASCESELAALQDRYLSVSAEVQELRAKLLPGH